MKVEPHLQFKGNCREAFSYYVDTLGAEILNILSYGESPASQQVSHEMQDWVVHATLRLGNLQIAGADIPDYNESPSGFQLLIQLETPDRAKEIFNSLADGGRVVMPLQETFWSPCYGMVSDRFGVPWEVNCAPNE